MRRANERGSILCGRNGSCPRIVVFCLFAALSVFSVGCAGESTTPNDVLRSFAQALEDNDVDAARATLLDAGEPGFEARFNSLVAQGAEPISALRASVGEQASLYATVPVNAWQPVRLVLRDGRWQIASGVADEAALDTPRAAALIFARAFISEDNDALRSIVPPEFRELMSDETLDGWRADEGETLEQAVRAVVEAADGPFIVQGDEAYLPAGQFTLKLLRVEGAWYVFDFL